MRLDLRIGNVWRELGQAIGLGIAAIIGAGPIGAEIADHDMMERAERTEELGQLRAKESDDGNIERGRDVTRTAVVAKDGRGAAEEGEHFRKTEPVERMLGDVPKRGTVSVRIGNEDELEIEFPAQAKNHLTIIRLRPAANRNARAAVQREDGPRIGGEAEAELAD